VESLDQENQGVLQEDKTNLNPSGKEEEIEL
jgi:hypothetical protein